MAGPAGLLVASLVLSRGPVAYQPLVLGVADALPGGLGLAISIVNGNGVATGVGAAQARSKSVICRVD